MSLRHSLFAVSAIAAVAALSACNNDSLPDPSNPSGPVPTGNVVALSTSGKVLTFNRGDLTKLVSSVNIRGLKSGEQFLGLDVRPQDSTIYGVTNQANIYTLDDSTGQATLKVALTAGAATTATCAGGAPAAFSGLSGTEFALDFNPPADRLRLASNTGQNLRINVADGVTIVDCPISFASGTGTPQPSGAAYTNSVNPVVAANGTELYYIDANDNMLYEIDTTDGKNANTGVLVPVGPLGVDIGEVNGYDIEGSTRTGYLVATVNGTATLYTVNNDTGAATARVSFAAGEVLRGISLK